jgi:hypothetical protein
MGNNCATVMKPGLKRAQRRARCELSEHAPVNATMPLDERLPRV